MFKICFYKYDSTQEANGYRGVGENDFSSFVAQGENVGEDIKQVLDTGEITLYGLNFEKSFDPQTKFIMDIVEYGENLSETIVETRHFVVSRDTVSQPILSDNSYFDHHISLIEPSVIAQTRLVDNISSTYKLKDVSLEERPAFPQTKSQLNIQAPTTPPPFGAYSSIFEYYHNTSESNITVTRGSYGKYFAPDGNLQFLNEKGEAFDDIYNNIESFKTANGDYKARFKIPKLSIMRGKEGTNNFVASGWFASIDYTIREYSLNDEYNPTRSWNGTFISNSDLSQGSVYNETRHGEWLIEQVGDKYPDGSTGTTFYFKKYTNKSAPTPTYITPEIDIAVDKKYVVSISIHQFDDNYPDDGMVATMYDKKFTGSQLGYYTFYRLQFALMNPFVPRFSTVINTPLVNSQVTGSADLVTYSIDTKTIVYASSTPYSALALLQKAIINSGLYEKQSGVYIADVNNSKLPFYIDEKFVDELSATLIIENFYNQKNLWEIMVEVGNYIHAIPELKFGNDDKFMITFNRLGRTDEKQSNSTHISVYNSRSIEDYISATSSYITNMVQLGGYIEEWIVPKTTSGQYLVSNDTAEIILSKPIIELLDIQVRRNSDGAVARFTDFVFEENVYKTLSIDCNTFPNRGIALYYKLGTNSITGGNYQLPQATTNIYTDYALKKAIYSAFYGYPAIAPAPPNGYWTNLKVNDYSFFIRYRTKDSVRQNHIRPDLRKYLLNSKWDRYPEHNQFNNQTDVVVDSLKFGNNMFGKLIKTGNNTYDIYEWNDRWENVKHKGELYRLNGELYYVAEVQHTIYTTHIVSKVSYSKDYNELSNIIGIPSEPRFYEISEQSLIWRDFEINDVLLLTDDEDQLQYKSNYVFDYNHLANLVIGEGTDFAKYAVTVFKGDKDTGTYDQTNGQANLYIEIINPINAYSSENTLTYEYDMEDNYSAGDKVITTDKNEEVKGSYNSLWAIPYTDIYGKAALIDFYILGGIGTPTPAETMNFPKSPIETKDPTSSKFIGNYDILATNVKEFNTDFNGRGIGLLKDCREAISINYNLRMATSSDTFVLSPYVYLPKKSNVRIVLLAEEVNKLSTGYIDNAKIITPIDKDGKTMNPYFNFTIEKTRVQNSLNNSKQVVSKFGINFANILANVADEHFVNTTGYQRVKSIAILCDVSLDTGLETQNPTLPYKSQFIVARNIPDNFTREQALKKWSWGSPNKDKVFKNKQ